MARLSQSWYNSVTNGLIRVYTVNWFYRFLDAAVAGILITTTVSILTEGEPQNSIGWYLLLPKQPGLSFIGEGLTAEFFGITGAGFVYGLGFIVGVWIWERLLEGVAWVFRRIHDRNTTEK